MAGNRKTALENLEKANSKRAEGISNYKQMSGEYRQEVLRLAMEDTSLLRKIRDEDPKFFYGVIVKSVVDKIVDLNVEVKSFSPFKDLKKFKTPQHLVSGSNNSSDSSEQKQITLDVQPVNTTNLH